jgi:signal transduction histidine kinase
MRRSDEIGVAVEVLADMQSSLRQSLHERARLAALGAAVAKINHDLRNILSPAQLLSDRLVDIDDPEVKRIAPRLVAAIDRAVNLSVQTLNYVTEAEPQLQKSRFNLRGLADEVGAALHAVEGGVPSQWDNRLDPAIEMSADRDQIYRVLTNIVQNAAEAGARHISIESATVADGIAIDIADDGPGLSMAARKGLFQPFAGTTRPGGTGLGLAISDELMRAHGGSIELASTGADGTRFRVTLPPA